MRKRNTFLLTLVILMTACSYPRPNNATPAPIVPSLSDPFPTPNATIPDFKHIAIIIFENREFENVVGKPEAPFLNQVSQENVLLAQYYAITHPSLPNYIALIGGDTYGYTRNCVNCPVTATNLADLIERSGRTWMTYQESMPSDCASHDPHRQYVPRHNPFMYFRSIVDDQQRCTTHVEELPQLAEDISNNKLSDFIFITPDICNSGHDCSIQESDRWLEDFLPSLVQAFEKDSDNYLLVVTWDEGQTTKSCCGLPTEAGGHIATILISPYAKPAFQDDTPYTTYSLLRTISEAWGLPLLGHAADANSKLILAPWK